MTERKRREAASREGPKACGSPERLQVLHMLHLWPAGLTRSELAMYAALAEDDTRQALQGLRLAGRVQCEGKGPGARWRLVPPTQHRPTADATHDHTEVLQ